MSDINLIGGNASYSGQGLDALSAGSPSLNTGALRRKYNFGDYVSELSLAQDPFFRFVSMVAKKPTDDPSFKFTERRGSWNKRYAYIETHGSAFGTATSSNLDSQDAAGDTWYGALHTDWNSSGNLQNIKGQTATIGNGAGNSQPDFFLPGQLIRVPVCSASNAAFDQSVSDYQIVKITNVDLGSDADTARLTGTVVRGVDAGKFSMGVPAEVDGSLGTTPSEEALEPYRCYVVGTEFGKGTGYPETWNDQPFSTGYGTTQIWKTSMAMDNTDRATVLKYEANEWARIWKEKLIEHKWDIEQSLLFGTQYDANNIKTTQGAVDFILSYGNKYSLDTATKTQDDFLDDLSSYLDPRYNNGKATIFFCNTAVYNWLHKLGGYFNNNLSIGSNFRADFAVMGKKKVLGLDATTINTPYGDMNVVRNIHLDGSHVKLLGINMKHCSYRPLVGNGLNRDTSVYVGVQTLENSGVDRRVDQILTEAGMELQMPEALALWT